MPVARLGDEGVVRPMVGVGRGADTGGMAIRHWRARLGVVLVSLSLAGSAAAGSRGADQRAEPSPARSDRGALAAPDTSATSPTTADPGSSTSTTAAAAVTTRPATPTRNVRSAASPAPTDPAVEDGLHVPANVVTLPQLPPSGIGSTDAPSVPAAPDTPELPSTTVPVSVPVHWGVGTIGIGPLDPSTDLFHVSPVGLPGTVLNYSWDGALQGAITGLPLDSETSVRSSPDGSLFQWDYGTYRSTGEPLGYIPWWSAWAEDNEHFCDVVYQRPDQTWEDPMRLIVADMDGTITPIADLPQHDEFTLPFVVGCSVRYDRAVVLMNNREERRTIVVRLSDGAVLPAPAGCQRGYNVNPSGRYLLGLNADYTANICDLVTGATIDTLPQDGALSGDGRVALLTRVDACGWFHEIVLVDRVTDEQLWSSNEPGSAQGCHGSWGMLKYAANGPEMLFQVSVMQDNGIGTKDPGPVHRIDANGRPHLVAPLVGYYMGF